MKKLVFLINVHEPYIRVEIDEDGTVHVTGADSQGDVTEYLVYVTPAGKATDWRAEIVPASARERTSVFLE